MSTTVTVRTNRYQEATGKRPAGFGSWVFGIGGEVVTIRCHYPDARAAAQVRAAKQGLKEVSLLGRR